MLLNLLQFNVFMGKSTNEKHIKPIDHGMTSVHSTQSTRPSFSFGYLYYRDSLCSLCWLSWVWRGRGCLSARHHCPLSSAHFCRHRLLMLTLIN